MVWFNNNNNKAYSLVTKIEPRIEYIHVYVNICIQSEAPF